VGRSVPDFALFDGTRPSELLRTGRGLLLDFDAGPSLQALARRWRKRIDYVASDARDRLGLTALLVRPDGVVGWVSEGHPDIETAARAAARWFGQPD
jgi:hypothetical protein